MSAPVISARSLTKRYGSFVAVDALDLEVSAGEVFGILGPNGAGKTTTILMLLGLTDVTSGSVRVVGLDPTRDPLGVKRQVGYMPDTVGFYGNLTGRENLVYSARLAGVPAAEIEARIDAALDRVRLADVGNRAAATYSRGMRQRLGLAEVLIKRPSLAILDEPTSGLDPHSAREFLELIRELKQDGITVVLSSHLLDRVQAVCDRVALFHGGRIVLEGTVRDLARRILGSGHRIELETRGVDCTEPLGKVAGVRRVETLGAGRYVIEADADVRPDIAGCVASRKGELLSLALREPSLDEVYNTYFERQRPAAVEEPRHAA